MKFLRVIVFVPLAIVAVDLLYAAFFWLSPGHDRLFAAVGVLQLVALLIILGLLPVFIGHVWRNPALDSGARLLWTMALLLTSVVALPLYAIRFYEHRGEAT